MGPAAETDATKQRLVVFSTYTDTPGQRFRIHEWIPALERAGIAVRESVFATPRLEDIAKQYGRQPEKALEMLKSLAKMAARPPRPRDFDAAFIYREMIPVGPPLAELALIRRANRPVAIDVDDPYFLRAMAYNSRSPLSRFVKDSARAERIVREVDIVVAINDAIAGWARQFARRVDVLPNIVPLERYPVRTGERAAGPVRLGYSGSPSTTIQLDAIREAVEDVDRELPVELRVMGGKTPYRLPRGETHELAWTAAGEAQNLASFDIGLAPAPDEEMYRYKSPVKVLLYMAMGLPVVTSPFGQAGKVVAHGVTGFHASTRAEWRDAIVTLARDPGLRDRMGAAGRAVIEAEFSRESVLPKAVTTFTDLLRMR